MEHSTGQIFYSRSTLCDQIHRSLTQSTAAGDLSMSTKAAAATVFATNSPIDVLIPLTVRVQPTDMELMSTQSSI